MGKGQSFQQMIGKLDLHMQRNEVGPLSHTTCKSYLKRDQKPKRPKTKLFEENIRQKLHDTAFDNDFLDMTPNAQETEE